MVRFQSIASSSAGCAYLLHGDGPAPLLLDAGVRYADIQLATGYKVSGLAGCLLSHAHGDHSRSIPNLLSRGVDCFASRQAWEQLLKSPHHRAHTADPESVHQVGPWSVRPFEAVHDAEGTLGFLIAGHGAKVLYLTDSAYSPYRFEGLTHVLIECNHIAELVRERVLAGSIDMQRYKRTASSHMSLERLVGMLKANDLTRVQEIHLLHLSDAHSDEAAMKRAVEEATGKPVYVAAKRAS